MRLLLSRNYIICIIGGGGLTLLSLQKNSVIAGYALKGAGIHENQ